MPHAIDIFRNGTKQITVKPDNNSTQSKAVMGDNLLQLTFGLDFYYEFKIGDNCTVFGETYKILFLPSVEKNSTYGYDYTLTFHAEGSDLSKYQYLFYDSNNQLTEPEFDYTGDAQAFADLLLKNANRAGSGWLLGEVIPSGYKTLSFKADSCASALSKIAEAFATEWWVIGKTIHLAKKNKDPGITFKHGRGKGLYKITRQPLTDGGIITRLYPFGADKNVPPTYGHLRLHLPSSADPCLISNLDIQKITTQAGVRFLFFFTPAAGAGISALGILYRPAGSGGPWTSDTAGNVSGRSVVVGAGDWEFKFRTEGGACAGAETAIIQGPTTTTQLLSTPVYYLENNVNVHGLIEATVFFDDIYPKRTGKVSAVNAADVYEFTDTTMDFNLNDYKAPGSTPKVNFLTGQLAGYTFDIQSYDAATKVIRIYKNKDEKAIEVPSSALRPAIGDEYVFVDIQLPQAYITAAENLLLQEATKFLAKNSFPQYKYAIDIDPSFVRAYNKRVELGDEVWLTDTQLDVNKKIRIINLVRKLIEEDSYQVQLGDTVSQGTITQIFNGIQSAQSGVNSLSNQVQNNAILNGRVIGDLKFEQGTAQFTDMPKTTTLTGFVPVYMEAATGRLFVKV